MKKLNRDQVTQLADISGNITAVWFAGSPISPIFLRQINSQFFLQNFIIGLFFGILFTLTSLIVLKNSMEVNIQNTYYLAAIISGLIITFIYFLLKKFK